MNKQLSAALLIIVSIFVLALKDSASLIHTVLHYFPNNPWHQHEEISTHTHHINPMEIHKHLQHKHAHTHDGNMHAHDVMDHLQHNIKDDSTPSEEIKQHIKIDSYFQALSNFPIQQKITPIQVDYFSIYLIRIIKRSVNPPYQPPQV